MDRDVEVVVIGAGQAGLSAAHHLGRLGVGFVVLDGEQRAGGAWQHRWPSLTLARTHHVHDLPGLPFPPAADDVPAAEAVPAYFAEYERHFALPVLRPVRVRAVRRAPGGRFRVETTAGDWSADAVVNATGSWTRPFVPRYPGQELFRGRQLTPADYRGAAEFAGQSVVVVGGGASAVQLLGETAEVADTTWVTRRPPVWREEPFGPEEGRAAVALVADAVREGRPPSSVVGVTGLVVTPWVREARARGVLDRLPVFDRLTADGVAWDDGRSVRADAVLWATGFRAALGHLAPLGLRGPGPRDPDGGHAGGRRAAGAPGRLRPLREHGGRQPGRPGGRGGAAPAAARRGAPPPLGVVPDPPARSAISPGSGVVGVRDRRSRLVGDRSGSGQGAPGYPRSPVAESLLGMTSPTRVIT